MNCRAYGGQSEFDESESGRGAFCLLCREPLVVTASSPPGKLSAGEQMAHYGEALKETDWGH